MSYCSDLSDRATLLMNREVTTTASIPTNIYRASRHNQVENIFPEIEGVIEAYYEVRDSVQEDEEWLYKVETELGSHIAFLATSLCESSRDYLVDNSEAYKRFDLDKQRFFK